MKQKKIWSKILISMLLMMLMTGVFSGCQTKDKTFVVGFDAEFPPYGYKDENGEYIGYDLDLAQEVWTVMDGNW